MVDRSALADKSGLDLPDLGGDLSALNICFDGQRVWSIAPATFDPDDSGVRHVPWPPLLQQRLDGISRVEVRRPSDGTVVASAETQFGTSTDRIRIVDGLGRKVQLNKYGRSFEQPFDMTPPEVLDSYLDQVEELLRVLTDECGVPAFVSFGTLLGAIRSGDVIGHDIDVDLGYFSEHRFPVDVNRESLQVERVLRRHDWRVERHSSCFLAVYVHQSDGSVRNIDIFPTMVVNDWLYQVHDVGTRGGRADVLPLSTVTLHGRDLPAPANPDVFLEGAYGPGWRTPDPGFSFSTAALTVRRIRGWFGGLRPERDRWRLYYQRPGTPDRDEPSGFARWVHDQQPDVDIIDVGCGLGADVAYFAAHGHHVLGLDFAKPAVARARHRIPEELRSLVRITEHNLYALNDTLALGARLARTARVVPEGSPEDGVPRAVFLRRLFGDLRAPGREATWRLCSMVLRGGGHSYVEIRNAPPRSAKTGVRLSTDALLAEAAAYGGRLVARTERRGAHGDPEDGPRARITRLVLQW